MKRCGSGPWLISMLLLGIIFIVLSGCLNKKEKHSNQDEQISSQLSPVLSIQQRNEQINFLIALENKSNHTVTLTFPTDKMFDITVTDSTGKVHFKHSDGKKFNNNIQKVEIKAGDSHIWTSPWKLSPERKAGIYKVNATITANKISPGSLKTEQLTMNETLTLQSPVEKFENQSFRNIHFIGTDGKYEVSGEARVFEGVFAYTLTDGHHVFDEQHTKVSEGAPAWSPFTININIPQDELPLNGTLMLELYYFSPKDGTKTAVLAVPLQIFK